MWQEHHSIKNGRPYDAQVIYGDTDSVMVKFGYKDLATCMKIGEEAAAYVSTKFKDPIKLEFEKVYFPYLLINKSVMLDCIGQDLKSLTNGYKRN